MKGPSTIEGRTTTRIQIERVELKGRQSYISICVSLNMNITFNINKETNTTGIMKVLSKFMKSLHIQ